jgi:carbamoyl-phosphate synthase large subunit
MGDKYLAHETFEGLGIPSPPSWPAEDLPAELDFPVLVKAREGFGSRHIYTAHDREELDFHLARTPVASFVQAHCRGEEFSIDVLGDFEGRCLNAIPRTMIESKGGESIKGMTIKDWELIEHGRLVAEALPIWGPANIQCFREPDGSLLVTDVNLRFGGAFPLPLAAGSRYPELALALVNGERPEPRVGEFREGVVMTRFFSDLCLTEGAEGRLEPFAEELPEPVASEPGEA